MYNSSVAIKIRIENKNLSEKFKASLYEDTIKLSKFHKLPTIMEVELENNRSFESLKSPIASKAGIEKQIETEIIKFGSLKLSDVEEKKDDATAINDNSSLELPQTNAEMNNDNSKWTQLLNVVESEVKKLYSSPMNGVGNIDKSKSQKFTMTEKSKKYVTDWEKPYPEKYDKNKIAMIKRCLFK